MEKHCKILNTHLTEAEEQAVVELASVRSKTGKLLRKSDVKNFALVNINFLQIFMKMGT